MKPAWLFDEFAHAGDEHLDPQYVAGYDRKAHFDPGADLEHLLNLGLSKTSTVIDFGAGTGIFALAVAPFCQRVVAIDVSSVMLNVIGEKAAQQGIDNIELVHAGFLTYEHRGKAADFAYSRHALHHLPDFWKVLALAQVVSCLAPNGVFRLRDLIFSFDPAETEDALEAWFATASLSSEEGWTRQELEIHVRTEYSPFSWLLESMFDRVGLDVQQAEHHPSGIYSAYTCRKR